MTTAHTPAHTPRKKGPAKDKPWKKVHNNPPLTEAKLTLRRNVLAEVKPAHVFDAFCGPVGEMYSGAWREAASYVGCDVEWKPEDPRRRYVGDSRRVMRAIDLAPFNVFDLDAFGSPFEWLIILAARRRWAPGERGAVVVTDGGMRTTAYGNVMKPIGELTGIASRGLSARATNGAKGIAPLFSSAEALHGIALEEFLRRSGVVKLKQWRVDKLPGGGSSNQTMVYQAIVFEGLPATS